MLALLPHWNWQWKHQVTGTFNSVTKEPDVSMPGWVWRVRKASNVVLCNEFERFVHLPEFNCTVLLCITSQSSTAATADRHCLPRIRTPRIFTFKCITSGNRQLCILLLYELKHNFADCRSTASSYLNAKVPGTDNHVDLKTYFQSCRMSNDLHGIRDILQLCLLSH